MPQWDCSNVSTKASSARGVTLTAAHLGVFLNSAQLACMAKFKIELKSAEVKLMPLTEVALMQKSPTYAYIQPKYCGNRII